MGGRKEETKTDADETAAANMACLRQKAISKSIYSFHAGLFWRTNIYGDRHDPDFNSKLEGAAR